MKFPWLKKPKDEKRFITEDRNEPKYKSVTDAAFNLAAMVPKEFKSYIIVAGPKPGADGDLLVSVLTNFTEDMIPLLEESLDRMKNGKHENAQDEVEKRKN